MYNVKRIFALLEEKGLTTTKAAKEIGISKCCFTDWKKGRSKPSAESIIKLAELFEVSTDFLLGCSDLRKNDHSWHTHDYDVLPQTQEEN